MRIYNNSKPVIIFILSVFILIFLAKFTFFNSFIDIVYNIRLEPSRDLILDSILAFLIMTISLIVYLIETIIHKKFSKLEIQILNENKQSGDTALFIQSDDDYKIGFIMLKLERKVNGFPSGKSEVKIVFPQGINVDWEDYSNLFEEKENELIIDLNTISLTNGSTITIPFQYNISSRNIEQKQNIEMEYSIKKCFTKYIEREIEIKGDN